MDAAEWDQLEALIEHGLALPPQEREAFLEHACATNVALREEVAALLSFSEEAFTYFQRLVEETVGLPRAALVDTPLEEEPDRQALRTGQCVSHYRLVAKLSGGGMGLIYKARDLRLERTVALKFLPPHLSGDEEPKRRFIAEAKAASALDHPCICTIYEIGETEDGRLFIAMAFYEGETLKQKIDQGPLPVAEALAYTVQIAEGLARAHEAGIIHRDVKPANVLVVPASAGTGSPGRVKIVDFGIAKVAGQELTRTGMTVGTVAYMSPEQGRGEAVDARTDLWSLGVVCYEMLAGQRPFRGEHEQAVLYAILQETPPPVRVLRPEVPERLGQVVEKLLRKDPAERYQHMDALLADLRGIKQDGVSTARSAAHGSRRRHAWIGSVAAVMLLVASGFGFYLLQASQRPKGAAASSPEVRKTIVVLPLENLGPPEEAYFAAGMTEEITSRLASVRALGVISRSSARQYAGTGKTLRQIGHELGVAYVLEGSVRWAGAGSNRVRITPHLTRVSDGTTVWSATYERKMADVFAIQAEIAQAVVEQLGVRLQEQARAIVEERPTDNLEAYHAYLQGLYYDWETLDYGSAENWEQAIAHFHRAVALDPTFALAYAKLAKAHGLLFHFGYDVSEKRQRMAWEAMEQALALAPEAPEVRYALGQYYYSVNKDYARALKAFEIAEEGLPNDPELLAFRGWVLRRQGRWEEALASFERALQTNPRDPRVADALGHTYARVRRYRKAIQYLDLTIALAPDEQTGYLGKAETYWAWRGDVQAARAALEAVPAPLSNQRGVLYAWFQQELYEGNYRKALRRLSALDSVWINPETPPKPLLAAFVYALLGEPAQARRAYEAARMLLEKELDGHPEDHRRYPALRSALGLAYAGLRRRKEAIREGEAAVAFLPPSKDALHGAYRLQDLALIYTMVGEYDAALDQIETLLSMPSSLSVSLLWLDPRWVPLRSHPRFQALLKKRETDG